MKKLIFAALLIASPLTAFASTQVVLGGNTNFTSGTANQFTPLLDMFATGYAAAASPATRPKMPFAGTLSRFVAHVTIPPGTGTSYQAIVVKGSTATALSCTISNTATTCSDMTDTVSFVAGDTFDLEVTPTNTPVPTLLNISVVITPTTNNDSGVFAQIGANNTTTNTYDSIQSNVFSGTTDDTTTRSLVPTNGTFDQLNLQITNAPTPGSTQYALRINAATTTLSCTISGAAKTCSDSTNSAGSAVNDIINLVSAPNGTGTQHGQSAFSMRFVPAVPGNFTFWGGPASNGADQSNTVPYFGYINLGVGSTTESGAQQVSNAMTMKGFTVLTLAPGTAGTGKKRVYTFRVNGADTPLTCTVLETATTCTATGAVTVNDGDLIDYGIVPTGTPAAGRSHISGFATTQAQATRSKINAFNGFVHLIGGFFRIR